MRASFPKFTRPFALAVISAFYIIEFHLLLLYMKIQLYSKPLYRLLYTSVYIGSFTIIRGSHIFDTQSDKDLKKLAVKSWSETLKRLSAYNRRLAPSHRTIQNEAAPQIATRLNIIQKLVNTKATERAGDLGLLVSLAAPMTIYALAKSTPVAKCSKMINVYKNLL